MRSPSCRRRSSCCSGMAPRREGCWSAPRPSGASVLVLPPVPPELVEAYASSADVGVSPIVPSCLNYRYSLPNKLFQYMAAGIPVVASDFRQVREVVEGSGCGLVVDTTRPEAIARGIRRVLADPAEAAAMGARGASRGGGTVQLGGIGGGVARGVRATAGPPGSRMSDHANFPRRRAARRNAQWPDPTR